MRESFVTSIKNAIGTSFVNAELHYLFIDGLTRYDTLINVRGLNNYSVPPWQSKPFNSHSSIQRKPLRESNSECYTEAGSDDGLRYGW